MKLISGLNYKVTMLFILLLAFSNKGFSQESKKDTDLKNWEEVEVKPEFQGGMHDFYKFIAYNLNITNSEPSGEIIAKFIIEIDGSLSNIEIIKNNVGPISGEETLRVLKLAPNWTAGLENGKPVRVLYSNLPIKIKSLYSGESK